VLIGIERLFADKVSDIMHDFATDHDGSEKCLLCLAILWRYLQILGFYIGRYLAHGDIVSRALALLTHHHSGTKWGLPGVGLGLKYVEKTYFPLNFSYSGVNDVNVEALQDVNLFSPKIPRYTRKTV
jgi:hypothetical protein